MLSFFLHVHIFPHRFEIGRKNVFHKQKQKKKKLVYILFLVDCYSRMVPTKCKYWALGDRFALTANISRNSIVI